MNPYIKYCILLCTFWCLNAAQSAAQIADTVFINFKQTSFALDAVSKSKLNDVVNNFYRFDSIALMGRASEEGTTITNFKLAKKRVDAVEGYFIAKNFDGEIKQIVFGEQHPLTGAENPSINRSVEMILYRLPPDEEQMQKFISRNYPEPSTYEFKIGRAHV